MTEPPHAAENQTAETSDMNDEFVDALLEQACKMQIGGWTNEKILMLLRSAAASGAQISTAREG